MFDAHLHLRDARILPYHARFVRDALAAGVTACIDCASRPEEWNVEVRCALEVSIAFGLHPWFVSVACPDWLAFLECALRADTNALVGEIGLDGLRKTPDGGAAQCAAFRAQLALAVRLGRPVVLHGARAWGALLRELEPWADRLPALLLHGVAFPPDLLDHPVLRRPNVWFGVGGALLNPAAQTLPRLAAAIPLDRLLVETDSPDQLPFGGEPFVLGQYRALLNSPANLPLVLRALSELRGVPFPELAALTAANAQDFLSAGR